MSPKTAAYVMRIVAWITLLSGIGIAAAVIPGLDIGFNIFLGVVIPGSEGMAALATTEARMTTAIVGGLFSGIGAMLLLIVAPAIEQGNRAIVLAATSTLLIWFAVDGIGSAFAGAPLNIVSNSIFLIAYLVPMLWVHRSEVAA